MFAVHQTGKLLCTFSPLTGPYRSNRCPSLQLNSKSAKRQRKATCSVELSGAVWVGKSCGHLAQCAPSVVKVDVLLGQNTSTDA